MLKATQSNVHIDLQFKTLVHLLMLETAFRRRDSDAAHLIDTARNRNVEPDKHNIHPTYIQTMITDTRYNEEDIVSVIDYLKEQGLTNWFQC